jgi:hypothetical protein
MKGVEQAMDLLFEPTATGANTQMLLQIAQSTVHVDGGIGERDFVVPKRCV